jgi:hypothetical protein
MFENFEIATYSIMGKSFTQENGFLVITCESKSAFIERKLIESFLEQLGKAYDSHFHIVEERSELDEIILVTNLPFTIYQKEFEGQRTEFVNSFKK